MIVINKLMDELTDISIDFNKGTTTKAELLIQLDLFIGKLEQVQRMNRHWIGFLKESKIHLTSYFFKRNSKLLKGLKNFLRFHMISVAITHNFGSY